MESIQAATNGDGRITNAIIMNELKHVSSEIGEMKSDIGDMKKELRKLDSICSRVDRLEKEQEKLRNKSDSWSILNSLGVFIAGLIAFIKGG